MLPFIYYDGREPDLGELARDLLRAETVQFGRFTLTSGKQSDNYVDLKRVITSHDFLSKYSKFMKKSLHHNTFDLLAGIELGSVPLAVALSLETKKPYLIVRKGRREHGTGKQVEGSYKSGQRVLVMEDVLTTGGSAKRAAGILEEAGLHITGILAIVDREEGAKDSLCDYNYSSTLTLQELLGYKI